MTIFEKEICPLCKEKLFARKVKGYSYTIYECTSNKFDYDEYYVKCYIDNIEVQTVLIGNLRIESVSFYTDIFDHMRYGKCLLSTNLIVIDKDTDYYKLKSKIQILLNFI